MHFLPRGCDLLDLQSAFWNWEPDRRVGVRKDKSKIFVVCGLQLSLPEEWLTFYQPAHETKLFVETEPICEDYHPNEYRNT